MAEENGTYSCFADDLIPKAHQAKENGKEQA